jgi:exopolysaccharide biosynthesis polyprenyl glycosylphosphotransferase
MSYTALNLDASSQSTLSRSVPVQLASLPRPQSALIWKRTLDIMLSVMAMLTLAPLMAAIALAIKLASPGQLIYRATRVGLKGRRFVCYKFRTMVADADLLKDGLRTLNEREGPCFKIAADPRITRLGRILRRYSLDELPQLWNVMRGEMSLVGPRPHPLDDIERYRLEHFRRLDVTPGITGLWQVTARRDPSFERNMALDLEYIEHWNLWMDLQILWMTVFVVFHGSGA